MDTILQTQAASADIHGMKKPRFSDKNRVESSSILGRGIMLQAQIALLSTRLKLKHIPGIMDTMLQSLGREFIVLNTEKPPYCDSYKV